MQQNMNSLQYANFFIDFRAPFFALSAKPN